MVGEAPGSTACVCVRVLGKKRNESPVSQCVRVRVWVYSCVRVQGKACVTRLMTVEARLREVLAWRGKRGRHGQHSLTHSPILADRSSAASNFCSWISWRSVCGVCVCVRV